MYFAEDEAERLPIGAFDTLSSGRDRKTRFVWVRYRAPNLIEKWYGLPIAVAAYLVAAVIFSRVDYGLRARPVTSWCCLIALDRASPAVEWIPLSWTVEPASSAARGARCLLYTSPSPRDRTRSRM